MRAGVSIYKGKALLDCVPCCKFGLRSARTQQSRRRNQRPDKRISSFVLLCKRLTYQAKIAKSACTGRETCTIISENTCWGFSEFVALTICLLEERCEDSKHEIVNPCILEEALATERRPRAMYTDHRGWHVSAQVRSEGTPQLTMPCIEKARSRSRSGSGARPVLSCSSTCSPACSRLQGVWTLAARGRSPRRPSSLGGHEAPERTFRGGKVAQLARLRRTPPR